MRFVFIGHNYETASMYMRGISIAKALQRQGIEAHYVINEKIKSVLIDKETICVFIKVVWPDTLKLAKDAGAKCVYDIIDNWTWSNLRHNWDFVIASNKEHHKFITEQNISSIVIPHLHTNFNKTRKAISTIKTVGYIGLDKQFVITKEMKGFCSKSGLKWHQGGGGDYKTVEKETLQLDLGLTFVMPAISKSGLNYDNIMKFKPATKLTNYFSYGIPALFNPTTAFTELISADPELQYLVVFKIEDIFNKINELRKNTTKFNDISNRCYALADKYHMNNAKEYYSRLI